MNDSPPARPKASRLPRGGGAGACGRRPPIEAVPYGADARAELEDYVRGAFARRHAAMVCSFMPTLLALRDHSGALRGVAGVRAARDQRLYLEQYLDHPIEQALAQVPEFRGAGPIRREDIIEVGNLAGSSCRAAIRLVTQLPSWLLDREYRWIVFTATDTLQRILAGFGAPLVELARADAARLTRDASDWGRYYQTDPRVFAGYLPDSERLVGFAREGSGH